MGGGRNLEASQTVRATGRTPTLPTPNAAAEQAASAYARHPQRGVDASVTSGTVVHTTVPS